MAGASEQERKMNKLNEELYRKWVGICQQYTSAPLTMNTAGKTTISSLGKVLLEVSHEEFETLTTNEIVEILRSNEDG